MRRRRSERFAGCGSRRLCFVCVLLRSSLACFCRRLSLLLLLASSPRASLLLLAIGMRVRSIIYTTHNAAYPHSPR
ncbi:hypothetical protein CesoFtcFv8_025115 [Champsocephalus esox]|uniref:Uncharacterized protein n=1 Tax=Champsocephalus esox TaxID=159716 RepID=A0AAN8GBV1_9TELE|nr:hypothetical protein CesoFtcFv8_025115 [Champsocephalus esox]